MSARVARAGDVRAQVRRAAPEDRAAVVDLWLEITRHHQASDPLFTLRPGARSEVERLIEAVARDEDAAIFVWDGPRGVRGLCIVRVDRAPPILEEVCRAEITDLGVDPAERRSGIASALVDRALAWIRDCGVDRVEVRVASRNVEGQAFWRARGFGNLMDVLQKRL